MTSTRARTRRFASAIGAAFMGALILTGCGLLGPDKAPQMYAMRPDLGVKAEAVPTPVRWQLSVAPPEANAMLDTDRIALNLTSNTVDYFANASWTDRAPLLVQSLLVQAFERTGRVPAVASDNAGIGADYILQTELRAFEAHYETPNMPPRVFVEISAKLVTVPERKIAGAMVAREEASASVNTVGATVDAFSAALAPALKRIVDWTLETAPL
jgi:cholesterol transport system auxiliary component